MLWLVGGEFFSNLARGLFTLTLGMMLYQITDGLMAFALAFVSEFVISLLLQSVSGSVTDRYSPKRILVCAGVLLSGLFLTCAIVQLLFPISELVTLFILAIGINLCRPFFRNATFAVIPEICTKNQYEQINSYISIALQVGQIFGMVLAGILLELSDIRGILFTVFGCFVAMLLCHCLLRLAPLGAENSASAHVYPSSWAATREFLRKNIFVCSVFLLGSIDYAFIGLFNLVLAPVVEHNFSGADRWLSILDIAFATGAIIGATYIARRKRSMGLRLDYTLLSVVAAAMTFLMFWLNAHYILILCCIGLFGFGVTLSTVVWSSTLQHLSPHTIKGRLASIRLVCNSLMIAIATLGASWAESYSYHSTLIFAVLFALLIIALAVPLYSSQLARLSSGISKGNHYA
jgi:MFS family permease